MKPSENTEQKELFNRFLAENNVSLAPETLAKLYAFADLVVETKEFGNLISPKDSEKILTRHIADSLVPFIHLSSLVSQCGDQLTRWADMGAGAGCPSFPLAIAMPQIQFYAVEPRTKRVQFMQFVKEKLDLKNMTVVGKRFETAGLINLDFISCRALSTFENDWERAKFNLKRGGCFVTLKSLETIMHLASDPLNHITEYNLPLEERQYALVHRFF